VKFLIAAVCLALATTSAVAQDKKDAKSEAKKPSAAQKAQQDRMKACNKQASDKKMKGEERQAFMSGCLKDGEPSAAQKAQQERMTACNKQATEKKLKGDERKKFMSGCLKS